MIINLEYYLDRPYKPGVNQDEVKYAKKHNQPLDKFLTNNERSIIAILNFNSKLFKQNVGIKILPKYFDFNNNKLKRTAPGSFIHNNMLDRIKSEVLTAINKARTEGKINTHEDVKKIMHQAMCGGLPVKTQKNLLEYYDEWTSEKSQFLKPLTIKKYASLRGWLVKYEKQTGKKLYFDDVNRDFDNEFRLMLIKAGLLNGTLSKYYSSLRAYLNWAYDKEYHTSRAYLKFKLEKAVSDVVYLTKDELEAIYNLDLSAKPGLDKVRWYFLFQCFTGQRYSDLKALKYTDIKLNGDVYEWKLFQTKGNKIHSVTIPLSKKAEEIFLKFGRKEGYLFECNSDPVTNRMLKEIAKAAGIVEPITQVKYSGVKRVERLQPKYMFISTHTARRTFITLSLELGLRSSILMKLSGHSSYKVMEGYMKLVDSQVKKEMLEAWD